MSLEASYEVLEMLRDDGVQTFRAKEIATGRGIELHLFVPFGRPENKALFEKLRSLPLDSRRQFLDIGSDGSTPYLVTDPLPGGCGFKTWADSLLNPPLVAAPKSAPSSLASPFPPELPSRDDSVQILQAGQWRTGTPIPESLIIKPDPSRQSPPAGGDFTVMFQGPVAVPGGEPPPASPPGEFTAMFRAPGPESLDPGHPPAPEPPAPAGGEFTRMFQNPAVPPPPPPPLAPEPPAPAGGEFTRMFQNPGLPTPPPPVSQPPAAGGEFTKFFESPLQPAPLSDKRPEIAMPPPPAPAPRRAGDFTEVFGGRAGASPSGSPLDQPPPPPIGGFGTNSSATGAFSSPAAWSQPQAAPSFAAGPSEYTKMMAAPAYPTLGQAPGAAPLAQAPPAAKKSNTVLYIALGVLVLLLVALALVFVFRQPTLPAAK